MSFTEKTQAYLIVSYYRQLTDRFGERGKNAFIHAVQYYGGQRGRRMAQRAIQNGETLSFETYCRYGEWVSTPECLQEGSANQAEILTGDPHVIKKVTVCPWHSVFAECDALDVGDVYCHHIDPSISRGFDPAIDYTVPQNLNSSAFCIHLIKNCFLAETADLKKHMEYVKGFDYHCAHLFFAFREVVCAVFGQEGEALVSDVLTDFTRRFGEDMTQTLLSFGSVNFNVCD